MFTFLITFLTFVLYVSCSKLLTITMLSETIEMGSQHSAKWTADGSFTDDKYPLDFVDSNDNSVSMGPHNAFWMEIPVNYTVGWFGLLFDATSTPGFDPIAPPGTYRLRLKEESTGKTFLTNSFELVDPGATGTKSSSPTIDHQVSTTTGGVTHTSDAPSATRSSTLATSSSLPGSKSLTESSTELPSSVLGNPGSISSTSSPISSSSDAPSLTSATASSHHKLPIGGIIGGVVGIAVLLLVVASLVFVLRSRRRRTNEFSELTVDAFDAQNDETILAIPNKAALLNALESAEQDPIQPVSYSLPVSVDQSESDLRQENQMLRNALDRATNGRRISLSSLASTEPPPYPASDVSRVTPRK
ncbi:hypothetical protein C8J56DRAFT_952014 [Mycena floridula]|nr:hypothetical protein C8J56DRAFT_952014 [Mycena floridula]